MTVTLCRSAVLPNFLGGKRMNKEELNRHDHVRELLERRDFGKLRDLISGLYPADAEELFEEMSEKERLIVFRLLPKDAAGNAAIAHQFLYRSRA